MTAVVTAPRCPLMRSPALRCEQVDELLLGWRVTPLEPSAPGWVKVRTEYRYEGHAPTACLTTGPDRSFTAQPKLTVQRSFCPILARPAIQSWLVAEFPRGSLLAALTPPDESGWVQVALPDGQRGYTKCSFLLYDRVSYLNDPKNFRHAVAQAALSYLGAPYRWGGRSPQGIDCSGLAFMAYWLNGVSIFRDARIEPSFPIHSIPRSRLEQGDLLYFPGHVAVYLGGGEYVHSTAHPGDDGVVLSSLDPAAPCYRADLAASLTACGSIF